MYHEKIFKRKDATRVKIMVNASFEEYGSNAGSHYDVSIILYQPRKVKGVSITRDDYEFRAMSMRDRKSALISEYLKHVTAEEILETKLELWNKLKPV